MKETLTADLEIECERRHHCQSLKCGQDQRMSSIERDIRTLWRLVSMPFLDRLEMAAVSKTPDRTVHDAVAGLVSRGLVASIRHATDLTASTRRLYVTARGLRYLADKDGVDLHALLRRHPVSGHWRRILLKRMDAVAVIYRLASSVAEAGGPLKFRWYRRAPLDAGIILQDGRTLGVVRQGLTSDRTGFSKRIWRLLEDTQPDALLVISPDEIRLRQARNLVRRFRGQAFLTSEKNAAWATASWKVWRVPTSANALDLPSGLAYVTPGGQLPAEPPLSRPLLPRDLALLDGGFDVDDFLLPVALQPALKRTMDILFDWPWTTAKDLGGLLGVSAQRTSQLTIPLVGADLARRVQTGGRERLGLTDWGIAVLARRDRTSVGRLRKLWSAEERDSDTDFTWRNVLGARSRLLARNMEHTEAVHGFLAQLSRQADKRGYEVVQLDPPHRASRFFDHNYKMRSIHPDAFGILRVRDKTIPFFLEWERRAVRPGTMATRLAPYLRYYSGLDPLDDHGTQPLVLIVFDDTLVESRFLAVARREVARTMVKLPLWVSHGKALEEKGPLGPVWRNHDVLEPTYALA